MARLLSGILSGTLLNRWGRRQTPTPEFSPQTFPSVLGDQSLGWDLGPRVCPQSGGNSQTSSPLAQALLPFSGSGVELSLQPLMSLFSHSHPLSSWAPRQRGQPSCSGLVHCHGNLEPPSPTAYAPLKNLSGKLPCLKINCGIEILKMSCLGQAEGNGLTLCGSSTLLQTATCRCPASGPHGQFPPAP